MSPFAIYLRQLRVSRGKTQKTLAHELGYEPSYLSAVERGEKGPPRHDFVRRLIQGLSLSEDERAALFAALKASRRQFSLPHGASDAEYQMIQQLAPQLGQLHPLQVQLIQLVLSIPQAFGANHGLDAQAHQQEDHTM